MSAAAASGRSWQAIFTVAVFLVVAVTTFIIVYPLGAMVARVFFPDGHFTLDAFGAVFSDAATAEIFRNTAVLVGFSTMAAVAIGTLLAWLNERTDASFGLMSELLPLIPLLVPLIATAIGWVFLLAPTGGFVNVFWRWLASSMGVQGAGPLFNIYSMKGMIFVATLCLVPYGYLIVAAALRNLDPVLEEASRISGASPARTLVRVTLPLVLPAIGAAFLLTLIAGVALFSVPVVIGSGARIDVVSVRIFRLIYSSYPPRMDVALVLSLMLMAFVQVAVLLQASLVGRGKHARIGGRGQKQALVELGRGRWIARLLMWLFIVSTTILPVSSLFLVSLQPYWLPSINFHTLGFQHFRTVLFENSLTSRAFVNSLLLSSVGATIAIFVGAIITLFIERHAGIVARVADAVTALPAAIPHTVIGVGFLLTFAAAPFRLQGTFLMLLMAYLVMYLPQAVRSTNAAAAQIGRDLGEASQVCGATPAKTFFRISFPLMLPGLMAGWIVLFSLIMGELTVSALLGSTRTPVLGQVMLDLWDGGTFPQIAALAVAVTVVNTLVVAGVLSLNRRRQARSEA